MDQPTFSPGYVVIVSFSFICDYFLFLGREGLSRALVSWRSCARGPIRVCLFMGTSTGHTCCTHIWAMEVEKQCLRLEPEWWRSHKLAQSVFSHRLMYDLEMRYHGRAYFLVPMTGKHFMTNIVLRI